MRVSDLVAVPLGRALGVLYVTGAGTASLWLVVPHEPDGGDAVVLVMAGVAAALGAFLVGAARRISGLLLHAVLLVIQVLIGVAYVAEGAPSGDLRLFFLWATPYAALYWGWRAATGHLAWAGAVVVTCLALMPAPTHRDGVGVGLMLLATLGATGVLAMTAASALRTAEAAQRHDAAHDPLTGLGNRRRLLQVLQHAVESGSAPGGCVSALVLLDLDGFKAVNDRYGHVAGDDLLCEIGSRLTSVIRGQDVACRLGGDEFALVVRGVTGVDQVLALANRAVAAATEARVPAVTGLGVGASAGVRLLNDNDLSVSGALREADSAMYASKRAGGSRPQIWTAALHNGHAAQLVMADDLRADLLRGGGGGSGGPLRLVYQPVVDIATLRVTSLEALVRWRHPTHGDVSPNAFVPCAERAGLIGELTRWVLHTGLSHASTWPSGVYGPGLKLAINVSAVQLSDQQVVADVRDALAGSAVPAGAVVLEVTETAAVTDLTTARRTLTELAGLGVALALDDFGTGYSSLSHVQALPFDILKVDRSFVRAAAAGDRRAVATIAAVGALAAHLDVDVVAEGVEDPAELLALQTLGCRYAQGFGLSRPMETAAVTGALTAHTPGTWTLASPHSAPARTP